MSIFSYLLHRMFTELRKLFQNVYKKHYNVYWFLLHLLMIARLECRCMRVNSPYIFIMKGRKTL